MPLRILHLDDNSDDIELVRLSLSRGGLECRIDPVSDRDSYVTALKSKAFDVILSDSGIPGYDSSAAMAAALDACPETPFIVVSGHVESGAASTPKHLDHAAARIPKSELGRLTPAIGQALQRLSSKASGTAGAANAGGMQYLVAVVQQLSMARNLEAVMTIVRTAARRLVGADGATFVLRDGDRCFYAEEDAISPLWKGQRFPLTACISGWAMLNREAAAIEDIYQDARIPHDAYRVTFVKSLVMTPIRTAAPVGAIGVYWANTHKATPEEVELLRALADSTSVAIESVDLLTNLEKRVAERTAEVHQRSAQLETLNGELEAFSYSVAHDLRSPLNAIDGFSRALLESSADTLDDTGREYLGRITNSVERMQRLVNDLLALSKIVRAPMRRAPVNLSSLAAEIVAQLREGAADREVEVVIAADLVAQGDEGLLRIALENLLSNAWKYSSKTQRARIELGSTIDGTGRKTFFVRDNGAGFDSSYASRLFAPFQRLHTQAEFPGTGVGLATVQRIIHRHGGEISAQAAVNQGAAFRFTLGNNP
jgi:signal transduction histidine kinase/CheY-like chemotaxis protein